MSYHYPTERPRLFTEEGQIQLLAVRDEAFRLTNAAGAVKSDKLFVGSGDTWLFIACMDRLIELGDLREVTGPEVAGQDRVFVRVKRTA